MILFTKSCQKDFDFLNLARHSVAKRAQEPIDWFIVSEASDLNALKIEKYDIINTVLVPVEQKWPEALEIQNGYLRQQWIKMNAHRVMDSQFFLNWDSDVIAVKHFNKQAFMGKSGRPIYWFSPYNDMIAGSNDPTATKAFNDRRTLASQVFNWPISFEWMRCMPIPMFSEILSSAEKNHPYWKQCFEMLKAGNGGFSEFNIIGEFAHHFFPDAFEWRNAETSGPSWSGGYVLQGQEIIFQEHAIVSQGWSWGGVPDSIRKFVTSM